MGYSTFPMIKRNRMKLLIATLALMLASCGGGGGGDDTTPAPHTAAPCDRGLQCVRKEGM